MDDQTKPGCPPLIFEEMNKLVESLDDQQQHRIRMELFLEQKQKCYEQLQQQEKDLKSSNASKNTLMTMAKDRQHSINDKNSYYRGIVDQFCESVNDAYQNIYETGNSLNRHQDKLDYMVKNARQNANSYEKKMDELLVMLNQLTEKRKKELHELELQMDDARKENMELNYKTTEYQQILLNCDNSDNDNSEDIERELTELRGKLSILDEDFTTITEEDRTVDATNEEVADNFQESVFNDLKSTLSDITLEVQQLSQIKDQEKTIEQKLTTFFQTLEDIENITDGRHKDTSNFVWTDLQQTNYIRKFSQLEQEIQEIQADIIGRNLKYNAEQNIYIDNIESVKKIDEEIAHTISEVTQLTSELNNIGDLLDSLNNTDDFSQKSQNITDRIAKLYNEKMAIEQNAIATDNEIQKTIQQLPKETETGELAILTIENTSLLEVKELNKQYTEVQEARAKLETDIKSSETEFKELEANKNSRKQEAELQSQKKQHLNNLMQAEITAAPIAPILVKKTTSKNDFMTPMAPESLKKKNKTSKSPMTKRNWDSDSSMEGEVINLSDFLKSKQRRRKNNGK